MKTNAFNNKSYSSLLGTVRSLDRYVKRSDFLQLSKFDVSILEYIQESLNVILGSIDHRDYEFADSDYRGYSAKMLKYLVHFYGD